MENENKNDQQLNEDETLIWNNNKGEEAREFEELAGINKTAMENIINELSKENNADNEFNNFQEDSKQANIFNNIQNEAIETEEYVPTEESILVDESILNQDNILAREANQTDITQESNNFFNFSSDSEKNHSILQDDGREKEHETEFTFAETMVEKSVDEKSIFTEASTGKSADEESTFAKAPADEVVMSKQKINLIKKLIANIQENSKLVEDLLGGYVEDSDFSRIKEFNNLSDEDEKELGQETEGKIIEGVFNGQCMIGPDGKQYNVPSNYASKSKLVEGDILKLTINSLGKFIYKQIGPIDRNRIVGILFLGKNSEYYVEQDGKRWRILTASVTYFKGNIGDETVILVPKQGESNWAAVENIVNKN